MENNMKVYFGLANENQDKQDLFYHDGNYYYYLLETDEEGFRISDTCNRYVPFDKNDIKGLLRVLNYMQEEQRVQEWTESVKNSSLNRLARIYGLLPKAA